MKKYSLTLAGFFTIAIFILTSCGNSDDPKPSAEQNVKALLTASPWKMNSVIVDNSDQTALYQDLVLNFGNTVFNSVNGGAVWPQDGSWNFTDTNATAILRNDGVVVTIMEIDATTLKLKLPWAKTTIGSGRNTSVSGEHVFTFVK
jgi:hypothetical protein